MSDRIEKTVELKVPVERVWRALTNHEEFGSWFRVELEGPFVLGKTVRGRILYPGYEHLPWEAKVVSMEEPRLFAFTWPHVVEGNKDSSDPPSTLVEFRLEQIAGGTRLTIVESGFDALPPDMRAQAMRDNEGGWTIQADNIRQHVEG